MRDSARAECRSRARGPLRTTLAALAGALLATSTVAVPVWAAPGWVITAATAPGPEASTAAAAAVLLTRTELTLDSRLGVERRERRVVRILKSTGLDQGSFHFLVEPGGKVKQFRAWTLGPGRDDETGRGDIVERTLHPEYLTDVRQLGIAAPSPRVGDVVAVELLVQEVLPFPSYRWHPRLEPLPLGRAELSIKLPPGWRAAARHAGDATGPGLERAGEWWTMQMGPFIEIREQEMAPPLGFLLPRVMIRFESANGPRFPDWRSVAAWYRRLSADGFAPEAVPADLVARAAAVEPGANLEALAREVQHSVRYAAIELGAGRWTPNPARETWQRRYGDCKDKAVLLVAALQARGIEARPALTLTTDHGMVDADWPDPTQFNHCIVALRWPGGAGPAEATITGPSGTAWTFFDPTATDVPLGMLPVGLSQARAVIADTAEGIVRLPRSAPSRLKLDATLRLDEDGALTGSLVVAAHGPAAGRLAGLFERATDSERRESAAGFLRLSAARPEIGTVEWLGRDSTARSASVRMTLRVLQAARRAGAGWVLKTPFPFSDGATLPEDSARALPLWLGAPRSSEARIEIVLPAGLRVVDPPLVECERPAGRFQLRTEAGADRVVLQRRFETFEESVPASRYGELRELLLATHRGDNTAILLGARR